MDRFRQLVAHAAPELLPLEQLMPDVWAELKEEFVPEVDLKQLPLRLVYDSDAPYKEVLV